MIREAAPQLPRFWGLDPFGIHDHYWASSGIQVVRRGYGHVTTRGPQLYLLVDPDAFIMMDMTEIVERMNWLKPRAIRLRLCDPRARDYSERILRDKDGGLDHVERVYEGKSSRTARAWLTPDRKLATLWAESTSSREATTALRTEMRPGTFVPLRADAKLMDAEDPTSLGECLLDLQSRWAAPGFALDGVYEYQPGVWLHETVEVDPGTRFVEPLWIGAGVDLRHENIVIGPGGLEDDAAAPIRDQAPAWDREIVPRRRLDPEEATASDRWIRRASKRLFDIAFSLLMIAFTLPVYPVVMLAIFIEDGAPFFFAHTRQTLNGKTFPCLKFRTMCRHAESMVVDLESENLCDGPQVNIRNDPRVLKVGHVLRRLQLDELPQFFNVLVGHMSVVGPRPSPDRENQYCPAWREARLSVRPGVTGLWQVRRTREPETDFQEWIRYDLEYVQHESWRLDAWILYRTLMRIVKE